jgi:hypothetical protein
MARLVVNPECDIYFGGWKANTVELGRHGWNISVEVDPYRREKRMILNSDQYGIQMLAVCRDFEREYHHDEYIRNHRGPTFHVVHVAHTIAFRYSNEIKPMFRSWADTEPKYQEVEMHMMSVRDMPFFLDKEKPMAKELIVEPQEVSVLLEQIMKMQSPKQAEIRKRNRDTPTVHASILSFQQVA